MLFILSDFEDTATPRGPENKLENKSKSQGLNPVRVMKDHFSKLISREYD